MTPRSTFFRAAGGFSLSELLLMVAVVATLMGIGIPMTGNLLETSRLNAATREVERELQTARLKAVAVNRTLRVRFNCPQTRQFRLIEVTGVATTDGDSDRCNPVKYPFPCPRDDNRATPEHDGPVRYVDNRTSIAGTNQIIEFRPNGTAWTVSAGTPQAIAGETTLTVTRGTNTRTVAINALGRVRLVP